MAHRAQEVGVGDGVELRSAGCSRVTPVLLKFVSKSLDAVFLVSHDGMGTGGKLASILRRTSRSCWLRLVMA